MIFIGETDNRITDVSSVEISVQDSARVRLRYLVLGASSTHLAIILYIQRFSEAHYSVYQSLFFLMRSFVLSVYNIVFTDPYLLEVKYDVDGTNGGEVCEYNSGVNGRALASLNTGACINQYVVNHMREVSMSLSSLISANLVLSRVRSK